MAPNSSQFSAITFDVDGTLYDLPKQKLIFAKHAMWHPKIIGAWQREKQSMRGHKFSNYDEELIQRVASSLKLSNERVAELLGKLFKDKWLSTFSSKTPLKGIKELIIELQSGVLPIGIISDHSSVEKLERMGLSGFWSVNIDCSSLGALKPRSEGIIAAAAQFHCAPEEILHIGDRADTDLAMAESVGAKCLLRGRDWQNINELREAISNITKVSAAAY